MAVSRLKQQLDAARQETEGWPSWQRMEIEAEVRKTPLRKPMQDDGLSSGEDQAGSFTSRSPKA